MHKLGRGHRDKLQQFVTITGASEKIALQVLKASDWHLEGAFDVFYSQNHFKTLPNTNTRHLEELYNRYKVIFFADTYADMILADGISLLCNDLQVDPQDIVMLVLSWHMKAATMCEFSKQEFIGGLQALGVDTLEKFCERIPFMRSELKDEQKFREIYNFAFGWAKEKKAHKAIDLPYTLWIIIQKINLFGRRNPNTYESIWIAIFSLCGPSHSQYGRMRSTFHHNFGPTLSTITNVG